MKTRIINICQYEKNPRTGEDLHFSEENIISALEHKTIKQAAYILHDKDIYNEDEEAACIEALGKEYDNFGADVPDGLTKEEYISREQWVHQGEVKPRHWHVVARCDAAMELSVFAAWFGVKEQYIDVPKGRGAFMDCIEYLTHEAPKQIAAGKHRYEDEEVHANFEFREELDRRALSRAKYGQEVDRKTELRLKVLDGELTLRDIKKNYRLNYIQDRDTLMKFRLEYIQDATPPAVRHNYYICGGGGIGKGVASILLAHALYPEIEDEDDLLFRVGADGTTFEGYDGQPVIIWDDCRSGDLFKKLGSRGNIFNVFETSPHKQKQNVKFGATNLINKVNIVNSVQPYEEFLNGLVGEYKDKSGEEHKAEANEKAQSYRRFPFIMPLRAEDFDILINRAYMEGQGDYGEYIKYQNIRGNFGTLIKSFPAGAVEVVNVSTGMVRPLIEARDEVEEKRKNTAGHTEAEFADYGKMPEPIIEKKDGFTEVSDADALPFD